MNLVAPIEGDEDVEGARDHKAPHRSKHDAQSDDRINQHADQEDAAHQNDDRPACRDVLGVKSVEFHSRERSPGMRVAVRNAVGRGRDRLIVTH